MTTDYILVHHGILGQKWGIRRYQNKDGSLTGEGIRRYGRKNLSKARTANMDKWGKDADHNVAYVAGYSGGGKTTSALSLLKVGDKIINLDLYSDMGSDTDRWQNKSFNDHLDKEVPRWREMARTKMDDFSKTKESVMEFGSEEYWKTVAQFRNAIESFGREQYKQGHKVVVEGIQIADDWLAKDKSYYKDKPIVILNTGVLSSIVRAAKRDQDGRISTIIKNLQNKDYVRWYTLSKERLDDLSTQAEAKKGQRWVKEYFKSRGDA